MSLFRAVCRVAFALILAIPASAQGTSQAYRIGDLDLRDPHVVVNVLGCRDITDTPLAGFSINGETQSRIQSDAEPDGLLDLSLLFVFDPLDQDGPGGAMRFGHSSCSAPMVSTTCGIGPSESLSSTGFTNATSGSCLDVLPGTVPHAYSPAISLPTSPCFVSGELTVILDLAGIPLTLRFARAAASYDGSPATALVTGLLRGFLTESDANATILPASMPLIGGLPFSSLLPGGDPPGPGNGNCAPWSDKDLAPDGVTPGWWMYFNFVAQPVPYEGPRLVAGGAAGRGLALTATPSPFRDAVSLDCWLPVAGTARVAVFDLLGREVVRLASGPMGAGRTPLRWDGRDASRSPAPPGLYVIRLESEAGTVARPVVKVK
jgi:hypothetical protein